MEEEGLQKTPNGLINIAKPIALDEENFWLHLQELYTQAYDETSDMKHAVQTLVPTYKVDERQTAAPVMETEKKAKSRKTAS